MMDERKWVNTESGVLALVGTDWRIEYRPNPNGDFMLMRGARTLGWFFYIESAKNEAARRQTDLEEIGVG
jgi:hypothetical protein